MVASDAENDPLTYTIVSGPSHGTLSSGTGASRTYTPAPGYVGSDSFTFKANDGTADSNIATVSITVTEAPSLVVTTLQDATANDGETSLREAINYANGGTAGTSPTITFASGLAGTITLGGTELGLSRDVTIQGPGAATITVSGNNASRVFNISSGTVLISGLTITKGNATGASFPSSWGGGIYNSGTLTFSNSTLSSNSAPNGNGGGIFNDGTLNVSNSTLASNSTSGSGGGIINGSGGVATTTVSNSVLSTNTAANGMRRYLQQPRHAGGFQQHPLR